LKRYIYILLVAFVIDIGTGVLANVSGMGQERVMIYLVVFFIGIAISKPVNRGE